MVERVVRDGPDEARFYPDAPGWLGIRAMCRVSPPPKTRHSRRRYVHVLGDQVTIRQAVEIGRLP